MAGRVPEHVIQQVIRGADFVRIAGRYCDLEKKGGRWWACCPFHEEKTPSFSVDPDSGLYYCFGCKEGGNVFTFLEKMEGLGFGEALKKLAAEAGVDLSRYRTESGPGRDLTGKLRAVNELATTFYEKCLEKKQSVRDYLAGRHITEESIRRWRLGYSPDGWEHFLKIAGKRGFEPELVARAGLAAERSNQPGYYDRFRNRLMFPIADAAGRTIAFGARALSEEDEPKYLNSPETPLFSKRRCFFGLSQARSAVRSGGTAVVLEGYTDVIMAHQAGVEVALAVLGTALTEDHARTLERLGERVVLLFDADEAGLKSAMRSVEVLLGTELEIAVATLPEGQDPCDFIVENGPDAFRGRLDEARGFFEFRIERARQAHDTSTVDGRMAAFRDIAELAQKVADPARRDVVVRQAAHELGVTETAAWTHVQQRWDETSRRKDRTDPEGEGRARLSAEQALPGELLGLLLLNPELAGRAAERLREDDLRDGVEKRALLRLLRAGREGRSVETEQFVGSLKESALASAAARAMARERERRSRVSADAETRLKGYLSYVERKRQSAGAVIDDEGGGSPPDELDDRQLRAVYDRLKERDEHSAQTK
ncbi:MAG: DNA primase [Planctomycetota bacterium]